MATSREVPGAVLQGSHMGRASRRSPGSSAWQLSGCPTALEGCPGGRCQAEGTAGGKVLSRRFRKEPGQRRLGHDRPVPLAPASQVPEEDLVTRLWEPTLGSLEALVRWSRGPTGRSGQLPMGSSGRPLEAVCWGPGSRA